MKKIIALFAVALALTPAISNADIQQATPLGGPVWTSGYHPIAYGDFAGDTRTDVVVSWTAPADGGNPISGYQVIPFATDSTGANPVRSTVSCSTSGSGRTCTVKGLAFATYYTFVVLATNSVATSSSASTTNSQTSGGSSVPAILTPGTDQTITMSAPPSPYTFGSADFKLTASASSGLPITWTSSPVATCTVDSSGVVHFLKAQQSCRITATQNGSSAGYKVVSTYKDAIASIDLSATANAASAVQGTAATLNGVFPYPGADVTPSFCVSATNPGANPPTTCSSPAGIIGTPSLTTISATSASTSSATVTGLESARTYYYWAIATSGSNKAASNVVTFTTLEGPTLTYTGSLNGTVGTPMSVIFTASGGSGAYAAWDKGPLPVGLSITYGDKTAVVSGTPTSVGSVLTWVYVEDSGGLNTNLPVTYVISAASGGGGGGGGGGSIPSVLPTPSPTPVPTTTPTAPVVVPSPSAAPAPKPSTTPTPKPTQAVPQPLPAPATPNKPAPTTPTQPKATNPTSPAPAPTKTTAPVPTPSAGPAPIPGTAPVKKATDLVTETVKNDGVDTVNSAAFPLKGANTTLRIRTMIQKLVP